MISKKEEVSTLTKPLVAKKKRTYPAKTPFVCPICNDVWQPLNGNEQKDTLMDFPRRGCSPNVCPDCK